MDPTDLAAASLAGLEPGETVCVPAIENLYLPVLQLLEPRLAPGALVIGDDSNFATVQLYLD